MYRHSLKSGNASGIGEAIRFVASGGGRNCSGGGSWLLRRSLNPKLVRSARVELAKIRS